MTVTFQLLWLSLLKLVLEISGGGVSSAEDGDGGVGSMF